jgi:DNA polymerase-3 subunit epsilon
VGVVVVCNGQITEAIHRLIRPAPNYYAWFCTKVHGMAYYYTIAAADFPAVWAEIAPKIAGLPLAAHNSSFDEGCLRAAHRVYGMEYPDYMFYCTCRASRKVFGRRLTNHQLHTVAARCGYYLQNHHHALADAEACAWTAREIIE